MRHRLLHARVPLAFIVSLALLLAAGTARAQEEQLREGESVVETHAAFPGAVEEGIDTWERWWVVRIVDAHDRQPIPGARVSVPWHPSVGVPDEFLHHQCEGVADDDGWVRLPWDAVLGWRDYVIADARGYAANEYCSPGDTECVLERGSDVPFIVLDYVGRPVPHATVSLNLGCAHIPAQRWAETDERGLGTLRDVLPSRHRDFRIEAPGVHRGYSWLSDTWRPGSPPVELHAVPGTSTHGRILDERGQPLSRVEVGVRDSGHHWTLTDFDGSFRLEGIPPWSRIEVRFRSAPEYEYPWFWAAPAGTERVFRVGETFDGGALSVRLVDPDGAPAPDVRLAVVRTENGATSVGRTSADGSLTFDVPVGSYRVIVDGELGEFAGAEGHVDLTADSPDELTLVVPRNPVLRVDAEPVLRHEVRVGLTTQHGYRVLTEEELRGGAVPVPRERPAAFRISGYADEARVTRFIPLPDDPDTAEPLVLDWVPATKVTARLVGPDGQPVDGQLHAVRETVSWSFDADDDVESVPEPVTETRLLGRVDWVVVPTDDTLAQATGTIHVAERGGVVDLGEVRLGPATASALRIDLPDDLTDAYHQYRISSLRNNARVWGGLDEDGVLDRMLDWVAPGDTLTVEIQVETPGLRVLPWTTRIPDSPPPWTMRYPDGRLDLRVRAKFAGVYEDAGPLPDAVVILDGTVFDELDEEGAITVRGIAPGHHQLVVAETDHVAKVYYLDWDEDEERALEVRLNPRDDD